ncbi:MAG: tgt [Chlamydiales bacterium]|jgi:queuine tRNA-ribosyltransferase|nr:tgt [Chlamydiales bacterium]
MSVFFELLHQSKHSKARVGRLHTPHGIIDTPSFVAVGTNATVKALDSETVSALGTDLLFCNTYHLMLQPGTSVVREAGGLHRFMNRTKPIITDSGGFQVFSLNYGSVASELKSSGQKKGEGHVLKISEDGVLFRSYRDGQKILLTPETSVLAQKDLGADLIIPFDELPPYHMPYEDLLKSLDRTHRWEKRSLEEHQKNPAGQRMYAVIHGGIDLELRKKSAEILSDLPFDGFAIGGSLGKNRQELFQVTNFTTDYLPPSAPRHLLGIGDLESLNQCVLYGIDTFDSSYPTKCARHGVLLTDQGPLKVTRAGAATAFSPPVEGCPCPTCSKYSLAYLCHLFKANESTAGVLASIHNIYYMNALMRQWRARILEGSV